MPDLTAMSVEELKEKAALLEQGESPSYVGKQASWRQLAAIRAELSRRDESKLLDHKLSR
jgi:hypothetical protein